MELLFWLWLYDSRWFFQIKQKQEIIKNIWLLPMFINLVFLLLIVLLSVFNSQICSHVLYQYLWTRELLSVALATASFGLILKAQSIQNREHIKFERIATFGKGNNLSVLISTYWLRTAMLKSVFGFSMLVLALMNIIWSWEMFKDYYFNSEIFEDCSGIVLQALRLNADMVVIFTFPLVVGVTLSIFVKLCAVISGLLCPGLVVSIYKRFG